MAIAHSKFLAVKKRKSFSCKNILSKVQNFGLKHPVLEKYKNNKILSTHILLCRKLQLSAPPFKAREQLWLQRVLAVRPSVTRADQSKIVQARITKSSPKAAGKTLVLRTVKLFHKFGGGHHERER